MNPVRAVLSAPVVQLALTLSVVAFWCGVLYLAIRLWRDDARHVPIDRMRERWSALPVDDREGHRLRFEGDPQRHRLERVI